MFRAVRARTSNDEVTNNGLRICDHFVFKFFVFDGYDTAIQMGNRHF